MRLLALVLLLTGCAGAPRLAPAPTVDVVTLNLWHDKADEPARLAAIADTLAALRPDVIVLQEVLQHAERGLANQAETLGARLGYAVVFVSVDGPGRPKRYGNAVLTRHPVRTRRRSGSGPSATTGPPPGPASTSAGGRSTSTRPTSTTRPRATRSGPSRSST